MTIERDAMPRDRHHRNVQNLPQERPMRHILIEFTVALALTLGAIMASTTGARANDLMVTEAFARASATPVAKSGAAYVSITNHGARADRLLSVATPVAAHAGVHKTVMEGDIMKMEPAGVVDIPAMGILEMKPGGLHIMMTGLKAPLKEGSEIDMTLVFETAGEVKVKVPVGAMAAGTHDHSSVESGD
jgi:periplasmic copper chaperone A